MAPQTVVSTKTSWLVRETWFLLGVPTPVPPEIADEVLALDGVVLVDTQDPTPEPTHLEGE